MVEDTDPDVIGITKSLRPAMVVHLGPNKDTGKGLGNATMLHHIPNKGASQYRSGAQANTLSRTW